MKNGLKEVYRSVVDYHNNLVHMRFTVAGLYLAGSAFLVNALFSEYEWGYTKITVCSLGIVLTVIGGIDEILRLSCQFWSIDEPIRL